MSASYLIPPKTGGWWAGSRAPSMQVCIKCGRDTLPPLARFAEPLDCWVLAWDCECGEGELERNVEPHRIRSFGPWRSEEPWGEEQAMEEATA